MVGARVGAEANQDVAVAEDRDHRRSLPRKGLPPVRGRDGRHCPGRTRVASAAVTTVDTGRVFSESNKLAALRAQVEPEAVWSDEGEILLESGLFYRTNESVRIRLRRRGHFMHLDDQGSAVRQADPPTGWFDAAERAVAEEGFNVNRRGVVSVTVGRGRDIAALALRLAESSRSVYLLLLDLQDTQRR
jgi:hypothetical protein